MKAGLLTACLFVLAVASVGANAGSVVVVYPRPAEPPGIVVYQDSLDSTFIFGRVEPPEGELRINGSLVPYTAQGAFLAFLPVRKDQETNRWKISLTGENGSVFGLDVPYAFVPGVAGAPDTALGLSFPRVVRVSRPNAHTLTYPGGGYHVFPIVGTPFLATTSVDGLLGVRLAGGMTGFIEPDFVSIEPDSVLSPAMLGNGKCSSFPGFSKCAFAIDRLAPWTAELSSDKHQLDLRLFDCRLDVNRFGYDTDRAVDEASWSQEPGCVKVSIRYHEPINRGYEIVFTNDSLVITVKRPYAQRARALRGKMIVVDPGHGGSSEGVIGPLGTREKDVTLRLAAMVASELSTKGAHIVLTRDSDRDVDLYDRIDIARRNEADFFLSLHANALPDGENPFIRHGTGTYFYQSMSMRAALTIHKYLLRASKLRDDGLYEANFAVARPTFCPSVLLEVGYLMYPQEEELLRSDAYLERLAHGITQGLADYFRHQD